MEFNIEYGGEVVDFDSIVRGAQAADPDVIAVEEGFGNVPRLAEALGLPVLRRPAAGHLTAAVDRCSRRERALPLRAGRSRRGRRAVERASPGRSLQPEPRPTRREALDDPGDRTARPRSGRGALRHGTDVARRSGHPRAAARRLQHAIAPGLDAGDGRAPRPDPLSGQLANEPIRGGVGVRRLVPCGASRPGRRTKGSRGRPAGRARRASGARGRTPRPIGSTSSTRRARSRRSAATWSASRAARTSRSRSIRGGPTTARSCPSSRWRAACCPRSSSVGSRLIESGTDQTLTFHGPGGPDQHVVVFPARDPVVSAGRRAGARQSSTGRWTSRPMVGSRARTSCTSRREPSVLSRTRFWVEAVGDGPHVSTAAPDLRGGRSDRCALVERTGQPMGLGRRVRAGRRSQRRLLPHVVLHEVDDPRPGNARRGVVRAVAAAARPLQHLPARRTTGTTSWRGRGSWSADRRRLWLSSRVDVERLRQLPALRRAGSS